MTTAIASTTSSMVSIATVQRTISGNGDCSSLIACFNAVNHSEETTAGGVNQKRAAVAPKNAAAAAATLRLAFLGCEVLPPYGPHEHTAELFADLIACAWSLSLGLSPSSSSSKQQEQQLPRKRTLVLEVYAASTYSSSNNNNDDENSVTTSPLVAALPSEEDLSKRFDGVVLPGSFSSAYDTSTPWIVGLGDWIQTQLVKGEVPTLGVCFGHQLYAHSFQTDGSTSSGSAIRCPAGPQAGRKTTLLTPSGSAFLAVAGDGVGDDDAHSASSLDLFYTHGDMVKSLPPRGVSLGGNEKVPIQAAVYFSSSPLPTTQNAAEIIWKNGHLGSSDDNNNNNKQKTGDPRVIAVTFQAHPEFACLGGETTTKGEQTLFDTIKLMRANGDLSEDDCKVVLSDAETSRARVNQQSLEAMVAAGRLLGWFR